MNYRPIPISDLDDDELVSDGEPTSVATAGSSSGVFEITDRQGAEWALRKIAARQAEIDLVRAQAADMITTLQRGLDSFKGRYEPQLEHWAWEALEAAGGKSRTVKTLCGNLSFRTVAARLSVGGMEDALQTAKLTCPEAVIVVETLDKKKLLEKVGAHFEATGELLPGIERSEERQSFSIKFATEKGEVPDYPPADLIV